MHVNHLHRRMTANKPTPQGLRNKKMRAGPQLVKSSRLLDSFDYRHCCKHTFELNALHKNANNLCQPGIFHLSLTSVLLFQCQPKSSSTAADLVRRRRLLLGQVGHFFSSSLERGFGLPQWLHSEHVHHPHCHHRKNPNRP